MSRSKRLVRVNRDHTELSVVKQCSLLGISRSSVYYQSTSISPEDLELMGLLDRQYLKTPYYGSRRMRVWLRTQGYLTNRKRVGRLMRVMGLEANYRKPNTSKPAPEHQVYPYLLRGVEVNRVNQVWSADITYLPIAQGFLYLVAIMDWHTRKVLAWRISNKLEAEFCVDALYEAIHKFGLPQVMNTDQGSQFTSFAWTDRLRRSDVRIYMDGKGRFLDNIFVERLWRPLKYECVYLHAFSGGSEARNGIGQWIDFYNHQRPHSAHGGRTPVLVYGNSLLPDLAA